MAKLEIADQGLTELAADKFTPKLESIDASGNAITVLPAEIGNCENLEELLLFANQLKVLPKELGKLTKLKTLNLFNNKVMKLPVEVGTLGALEEVQTHRRGFRWPSQPALPVAARAPGCGGGKAACAVIGF